MSKQDDLKFLQDEILGKQNAIKVSTDFNDLDKLANGSFMFIVLGKSSLSSNNPPNDEVGLLNLIIENIK